MPYFLVAQAAVIWLVVRFARSAGVPGRSKRLVVGLTAATFLAPWLLPATAIPAALIQLALGVSLAVHRMLTAPDAGAPPRPAQPTSPPASTGVADRQNP